MKKRRTYLFCLSALLILLLGCVTAEAKPAAETLKTETKMAVKQKSPGKYVKKGRYYKWHKLPSYMSNCYMPSGDFLTVIDRSSTHIRFVIEHCGVNGSPIYYTNLIRVKVSKNKTSTFRWKDSWGNRGTGRITFKKGQAVIQMKYTKTSRLNRWGWPKKMTIPFKTSKITAKQRKAILKEMNF